MPQTVRVQSIEALTEFRAALIQARTDLETSLRRVAREISQTREWLNDRIQHWRRAVAHAERTTRECSDALQRCLRSGDREHPPDCGGIAAELRRAERMLEEAREELSNALHWSMRVEECAVRYERRARMLSQHIGHELPKAVSSLESSIASLDRYVSIVPPAAVTAQDVSPRYQQSYGSSLAVAGLAAGTLAAAALAAYSVFRRSGYGNGSISSQPILSATSFAQTSTVLLNGEEFGFSRALHVPNTNMVVLESIDAVSDGATQELRIQGAVDSLDGSQPVDTVAVVSSTGAVNALFERDRDSSAWVQSDFDALPGVPRDVAGRDAISGAVARRSIREVRLADIDFEDIDSLTDEDFKKATADSMLDRMLAYKQFVAPHLLQGASADDFSDVDERRGLSYDDGYRAAYDMFYGNDPVRLDYADGRYTVISGRHRIILASILGWKTIPARVNSTDSQ